ncbi:hypothetical protein GFB49_13030 [Epibacterium sp. SM1979]|uniref:NTP pyrophosphohydrolase MazG putative catalytic core domain-containing protein n=1 Tax=Tritonibacter litoralis TaxID=2662264 RepID=A0A843YIX3_9RHOB|nr:hypothetical protein [Tritonibacter litoralis]MQQ09384.1 hypothetical protein [Tritonibacter litoralis]
MGNLEELSEVAQKVSDVYAARFEIERDAVWHLAKLGEELGELQAAYLKLKGQGRSEAAPDELRRALEDEVADLFAQILLFARWEDIDVSQAVMRKWGQYLE